ncbi:MAG: hypothetical protein IKE89_03585 [Bacilli bacterium]|nr:hypothetical protein [Bacilli bacterium]MBR2711534.1 hypothetical protein [Bacilli bacterium]
MKITNKLGLPDMLQRAVEKEYIYRDKRYSITSLLDSDRVLMLKRRYNDVIEQDISECIWMLFGTVTHYALETGIELKENEHVELHLEHTFENGYTLSGIIDHIYDYIDDYKTTSVWTVIYGSNNEHWKKQLQMGAYLFYKETGKWINKGRIIAILKDWNRKDSEIKENYPKLPVEVINFDLGTPEEIETWILDRFEKIKILEQTEDINLPMCSLEERFNKGDTFAVKKKANKTALKVHKTLEEAQEHLNNLENKYPGIYEIEIRKGEDTKCLNYCNCNKQCPYYLMNYDKDIKEISEELSKESENNE